MNIDNITKEYLQEEYSVKNKSWKDIASELNTYPNKIRRIAKQFGLISRSISDAQKELFKTGKRVSPTKGRKRTDEEKLKISSRIVESWQNKTVEEKKLFSESKKRDWDNTSEAQKELFRKKSRQAIKKASKDGSKLEIWLYEQLVHQGFHVDFHKEQVLMNDRLQLDMYLPKLGIAIEVDGLSHFEPIWGQKNFTRNVRADQEKAGLLLARGITLIRIKNDKNLTLVFQKEVLNKLVTILNNPPKDKYIIL